MTAPALGILHPGEMGASVAASARNSGQTVYWASEGRGAETRARAERAGLLDAGSLDRLCDLCAVIVSVCPPAAAEAVADSVFARGFTGLFLDANAISPARARRIAQQAEAAGAAFVDGGIVGGPAWQPGETWLYLAGPEAERAAACFSAGPLETQVIGREPGKASALKMCYAAYTKGTTALLCAALAAADALGVRDELEGQWERDSSGLAAERGRQVRQVSQKAWRFAGEMEEIAATMRAAGLPGGFHGAAGEVYRRIADFKGAAELPALGEVLDALLDEEGAREIERSKRSRKIAS